MCEQGRQIYALSSGEWHFIESCVAALERSVDAVPSAIQHGDPGVWNLLAGGERRVALLDWEAGDLDGVPLWDLLYFLRTYAVAGGRARGAWNALDAVQRELLAPSPMHDAAVAAMHTYCARSGMPTALVEPLSYLCWLHRALKEATRLAPAELGRSRYLGLLKLLIAERERLPLRRLMLQ